MGEWEGECVMEMAEWVEELGNNLGVGMKDQGKGREVWIVEVLDPEVEEWEMKTLAWVEDLEENQLQTRAGKI